MTAYTVKGLTHARDCYKCLVCILSVNPCNSPKGESFALLSPPVFRKENRGTEKLIDLSKVIVLARDGGRL